jgi:hypothetical protein
LRKNQLPVFAIDIRIREYIDRSLARPACLECIRDLSVIFLLI